MKYLVVFLLMFFFAANGLAQQINIEKWAKHNIDSLHRHKIDTLIYFNESCDECFIKSGNQPCNTLGESTQIENIIIYQQSGKCYTLKFNCRYPPILKQTDSCKSIPFALSIIPTLNSRDKAYKLMIRQGKFGPPTLTDGTSEHAAIYFDKIKQGASIRLDMPNDLFEEWQKFYWFDKEVELFKLIKADLRDE